MRHTLVSPPHTHPALRTEWARKHASVAEWAHLRAHSSTARTTSRGWLFRLCSPSGPLSLLATWHHVVVRIAIGADHAGYELKQVLVAHLRASGHDVDDVGTHSADPVDYPPICADVARRVASGHAERGIVLGGSGQGEQIAANKVPGIRAALCNDLYTARLSREHNDANVLSMGARIVAAGLAIEILDLWLATDFEGGRHQRRIAQIADLERDGARAPDARR